MIGKKRRIGTWAWAVPVLLLCAALAGCGGGDGGGSNRVAEPIVASFTGSGTPSAPDQVRLIGRTAGNTVSVEIRIGGATTSADLYSFAFDLVFGDPDVARYVAGSAAPGDALTLDPGQQIEVLVGGSGDRSTVGISILGGGTGSGVPAGEFTLVMLEFRVTERGSTTIRIEGSPQQAPTALDSVGNPIASIQFDANAAVMVGD